MGRWVCRLILALYLLLYLAALYIAVVGSFGLLGHEPEALASVFLVFIALPWSFDVLLLTFLPVPIVIPQVLLALAPLLNAWLIHRVCSKERPSANAQKP